LLKHILASENSVEDVPLIEELQHHLKSKSTLI